MLKIVTVVFYLLHNMALTLTQGYIFTDITSGSLQMLSLEISRRRYYKFASIMDCMHPYNEILLADVGLR